jgi:hypothetical protein
MISTLPGLRADLSIVLGWWGQRSLMEKLLITMTEPLTITLETRCRHWRITVTRVMIETRVVAQTLRRVVPLRIRRVNHSARSPGSRAQAVEAGRNKPAAGESNLQSCMPLAMERNRSLSS